MYITSKETKSQLKLFFHTFYILKLEANIKAEFHKLMIHVNIPFCCTVCISYM